VKSVSLTAHCRWIWVKSPPVSDAYASAPPSPARGEGNTKRLRRYFQSPFNNINFTLIPAPFGLHHAHTSGDDRRVRYFGESHVALAELKNAGIPAVLTDEQTVGMLWVYANAVGGIKVQSKKKTPIGR